MRTKWLDMLVWGVTKSKAGKSQEFGTRDVMSVDLSAQKRLEGFRANHQAGFILCNYLITKRVWYFNVHYRVGYGCEDKNAEFWKGVSFKFHYREVTWESHLQCACTNTFLMNDLRISTANQEKTKC